MFIIGVSVALVKAEGREQSCCLSLLDWQCWVNFGWSSWERWLLIPPQHFSWFSEVAKIPLGRLQPFPKPPVLG